MNSMSGTTSMAHESTKRIDPSEICAMIKACGEAKVSVLKYGDLYLCLGERAPVVKKPATPVPDTEISVTQKNIERESFLKDEQQLRQDRIAQALIEDPLEAERLLMSGEFVDDPTLESDDEEA